MWTCVRWWGRWGRTRQRRSCRTWSTRWTPTATAPSTSQSSSPWWRGKWRTQTGELWSKQNETNIACYPLNRKMAKKRDKTVRRRRIKLKHKPWEAEICEKCEVWIFVWPIFFPDQFLSKTGKLEDRLAKFVLKHMLPARCVCGQTKIKPTVQNNQTKQTLKFTTKLRMRECFVWKEVWIVDGERFLFCRFKKGWIFAVKNC